MNKFISFVQQRSGQLLDQHPDIFCGEELFVNQKDIHHQE